MNVIVTLSTIPTRFGDLEPTLQCLLNQTANIDEIRLYIPKRFRRFPNYDGGLPDVPNGIRVIQTEEDLGPATKVLFAAEELGRSDDLIIYCDDDMLYEPDRFQRMIDVHLDGHTGECIASTSFDLDYLGIGPEAQRQPRAMRYKKGFEYRAKRAKQLVRQMVTLRSEPKPACPKFGKGGYADFAEGFGGVLVRADFFDDLFYDIPDMLWAVDDIWISGHLERRNIPIWTPPDFPFVHRSENHDNDPLYLSVIDGADRGQANQACIRYMQEKYNIWV